MLYCPNFFWNALQVWMTGKDVYLQMTWSWPDKTWNILCSYCLQWNTSQSKFRNHYFLFLFAFSILSQLFLIWGCVYIYIYIFEGQISPISLQRIIAVIKSWNVHSCIIKSNAPHVWWLYFPLGLMKPSCSLSMRPYISTETSSRFLHRSALHNDLYLSLRTDICVYY